MLSVSNPFLVNIRWYVVPTHPVQKYSAPLHYTVYNLSNLLNVSATRNLRLAFELILTTTLYSSMLADFLQSESHLFL